MDWYTLSRKWFDFVFENPEKPTCTEWIVYMWIIECWNRNWKSLKFWLPTFHSMGACWIKSPNTYHKALKNLISYWFIEVIQEAKNQNTSMVISLSAHLKNKSAHKSALDIALIQQLSQQEEHIKQVNKETNKQYKSCDWLSQEQIYSEMELFINSWNERLKEDRKITDKLKEKYLSMRKNYSIEELRKSFAWYYEAKKISMEYRISPLAFITQQNWIPNYL